ncbi:hypothetical protein ILYODFUR_033456 [Ilyodon furcidens]|uniref:Secreted protein n=1 Tax=Ilyodon furcidens TaxID=33524 RepID=A0ABV0TZX2_9TELE
MCVWGIAPQVDFRSSRQSDKQRCEAFCLCIVLPFTVCCSDVFMVPPRLCSVCVWECFSSEGRCTCCQSGRRPELMNETHGTSTFRTLKAATGRSSTARG